MLGAHNLDVLIRKLTQMAVIRPLNMVGCKQNINPLGFVIVGHLVDLLSVLEHPKEEFLIERSIVYHTANFRRDRHVLSVHLIFYCRVDNFINCPYHVCVEFTQGRVLFKVEIITGIRNVRHLSLERCTHNEYAVLGCFTRKEQSVVLIVFTLVHKFFITVNEKMIAVRVFLELIKLLTRKFDYLFGVA